jgi:hypothetical protein
MSAFRIKARLRPAPASRLRSFANAYAYELLADKGICSPHDKAAFDRHFNAFVRRFRPVNSVQFAHLAELAVPDFALRRYCALQQNTKLPNEPNPISGHHPDLAATAGNRTVS